MLRDALLVFDKQVFNIGLELMFKSGSDVAMETFVVDSMIVGSMVLVAAEKKLL